VPTASEIRRLEGRLNQILAERSCELCVTRIDLCPKCRRPVGALPNELERTFLRLQNMIDGMLEPDTATTSVGER
jgi:hypothetical protein